MTLRNSTLSLPSMPTTAAAMARFCGEIILPSTPPEVFAEARRYSLMPVSLAAVTCSTPNSEFDEVSDPVTATPIQPTDAERKANSAPVSASAVPRVPVWPEKFMT